MENYEATNENHVSGGDSGNHGLPRATGAIARLAYARAKAAGAKTAEAPAVRMAAGQRSQQHGDDGEQQDLFHDAFLS